MRVNVSLGLFITKGATLRCLWRGSIYVREKRDRRVNGPQLCSISRSWAWSLWRSKWLPCRHCLGRSIISIVWRGMLLDRGKQVGILSISLSLSENEHATSYKYLPHWRASVLVWCSPGRTSAENRAS